MQAGMEARMAYPTGGGKSIQYVSEHALTLAENVADRDQQLAAYERYVFLLGDHHIHLSTNGPRSPRLVPSGSSVVAVGQVGGPILLQVRPGTAARAAGLREGMRIVEVNGKWPTVTMPHAATAARLLALVDYSTQILLAGRQDQDALVVAEDSNGRRLTVALNPEIARPAEPVSLTWAPGRVAILRIHNRLGDAALVSAFDAAMRKARRARAIVLDLRDTPSGGDSVVARPLMAWFVEGVRGYQIHETDERRWTEYVSGRPDRFRGRLVVLVDGWTASMGEGVAIGLRSAAGAVLVGAPMAGLRGAMGSVDLPCFGASLRFPVERLFAMDATPRELAQPDIVLDLESLAGPGDPILEAGLAAARKR